MRSTFPAQYSNRMVRAQFTDVNTLEIPSAYNAPTRGDVVRVYDSSTSGNLPCNCDSGKQGGNPTSGPQNPYQMPGPQGLAQPPQPQKPFQTPTSDPCQMTKETLQGMGIDPNCLGGSRTPRKARTRKKKPVTKLKKRRSKTKLTTKQLFPKASGKSAKGGFRILANGACYDVVNRKFVKKAKCQ